MAHEIERKFLVRGNLWIPDPSRATRIRQGYLSTDPARVVRVRTRGSAAYLTIKGLTVGIARVELEYPIPLADADLMLDQLCVRPLVEKVRYLERVGEHTWEIDVFHGENAGLILAEVELPSADASIDLPTWAGDEVSDDPRYFNSNLARHPYAEWRPDGDRRSA
ncbi:MAG TPA: CYTH domain-containing protein [Gemmatimonadaceae bacterium]|nr:CYTH domain-containing protein [Gemmatimonadaceae bacterium]